MRKRRIKEKDIKSRKKTKGESSEQRDEKKIKEKQKVKEDNNEKKTKK